MERARKTIKLSDGREITVEESTWETASKRSAMEERTRAEKSKLNGSGDAILFYFVETYYSYMSSCSTGSFPDPLESLSLPDEDLDRWYEAVIEVNPEAFLPVDRSREGEVVFRDGSSFRIVSSYRLSVSMKRARLEEEALRKEEDRNNPKDVFSVVLYPILASCSIGDVPDPETIRRTWPETEIYKWRDAVKEVNPQWFMSDEQLLEQAQAVEKKRPKSRERSRSS